jgi:uncharacterized membrane protein
MHLAAPAGNFRETSMDKRTVERVTQLTQWALAAGVGALLMRAFGPGPARTRVLRARDRFARRARDAGDLADAGLRDFGHRTSGYFARLRRRMRRETPDDATLVERVRAQLGRLVSHPHAVDVDARDGHVTLSGDILKAEEHQLLEGVREVNGVAGIDSRLQTHRTAENVPMLQGGRGRPRPRMEYMQQNWAPGPRLLALGAGSALAAWGLTQKRTPAALLGLVGVGIAMRAATNQDLRRTLGMAGGRRGVDIRKTIHIAAPREHVFDRWCDFENFPQFMSHVEEVRPVGDDRYHWTVRGPAGVQVEWDAVVTALERPDVIAWRTEPGAPVQHAGIVHFDNEAGGTRVTVRMSYNPPGGSLGHAAAALLDGDPKRTLDADLLRMKAYIETGVPPHDAVRRDTVTGAPSESLIEDRLPR